MFWNIKKDLLKIMILLHIKYPMHWTNLQQRIYYKQSIVLLRNLRLNRIDLPRSITSSKVITHAI
ncbi:hypothetical protein BI308_13485 [Roseofilum reptotaenium AO1-A]|uniref:Uncharacterized protein n=1 Tax=Roseofilum reptotaenium AO1-A TaxID=1925591 RepID=A0A1L9QR34_9CYAN|nr:hypothetical protein BI308_13485 [Roseofilum reptotaenium AO1-A]